MWKVTKHKCSDTLMELNVATIVRDMAEVDWITYSEQVKDKFEERVRYIPQRNGYSAEVCYQIKKIDLKTVEVWKTTPAGDPKYKMFTLNYIPEN